MEFGMNAFDGCGYDGHGGRQERSTKTNEALEQEDYPPHLDRHGGHEEKEGENI